MAFKRHILSGSNGPIIYHFSVSPIKKRWKTSAKHFAFNMCCLFKQRHHVHTCFPLCLSTFWLNETATSIWNTNPRTETKLVMMKFSPFIPRKHQRSPENFFFFHFIIMRVILNGARLFMLLREKKAILIISYMCDIPRDFSMSRQMKTHCNRFLGRGFERWSLGWVLQLLNLFGLI